MRTKKLLLSEEILRISEIFSHMGINVLLEGRMLGREAGTGIEALAPGSAIRSLVGETTAKNIEDDFIRAAENSQNIMRQIGKNVGDGVTMDELETAFFAANRAAVAAKVLESMEPAAAKEFMDNTANYIFNKNSSATGTGRAGTTNASLQSLNSLIKSDMTEVTAERIINNISAYRTAIDGLADDVEKANWKKALDLAETQAKTVKLKPAEGTAPGPGPRVNEDPYTPTPQEEQLGSALDDYFANTPPPTTVEELETAIEQVLINMRNSGFQTPSHITWDELIEQTKIELRNVPEVPGLVGVTQPKKWQALGPARQKQLIQMAKDKFPAPEVPKTTGSDLSKRYSGIRGFLFNRFFNKEGRIAWGAVYWYGLIVSLVECGFVKGTGLGSEIKDLTKGEGSTDEVKQASLELLGCAAMSFGSWLGLVLNVSEQIADPIGDVFKSYQDTVESFKEFLKEKEDIDTGASGFGANKNEQGKYFYFTDNSDPTYYKFENNTFKKQ